MLSDEADANVIRIREKEIKDWRQLYETMDFDSSYAGSAVIRSLLDCGGQGTDNRKQNRMEGTTEQQTEESSASGNDSAVDKLEGKEQVQDNE